MRVHFVQYMWPTYVVQCYALCPVNGRQRLSRLQPSSLLLRLQSTDLMHCA